ncbi:hypothetical protein K0819_24900 (plasmid) [Vibrio parahaemolyticus]|uniref:hypothetical protein n=1 Tax=Vibrio parahaemolyticus TaxID=670 RepID=UPI0002E4B3B4|nr:hypothetical protein [Vibrio parahaemolyticus]WCM68841.1 hypothetical protein K0819_24900 [Vibrio parahaemolyticus]
MMTPEEIQEAVLAIVARRPAPKAKASVSQGRLIDIKKRQDERELAQELADIDRRYRNA